MDTYSRGALIKKFQSKGGRLFKRGSNSRVGADLSTYGILFEFSFSGKLFLLVYFFNSINASLTHSTISSFTFRLLLYNPFAKNSMINKNIP